MKMKSLIEEDKNFSYHQSCLSLSLLIDLLLLINLFIIFYFYTLKNKKIFLTPTLTN